MFAVCVTIEVEPGQLAAFLPLMHQNAQASLRNEAGCHQFDVCTGGPEDPVFLYELYTDAAAFDAHLKTAHFLKFDRETAAMIKDKRAVTYDAVFQPGAQSE